MKKRKKPFSNNSKNDLLRYAGLGTQMLVSIGIAVFVGLKADQWLHTLPLFSCVITFARPVCHFLQNNAANREIKIITGQNTGNGNDLAFEKTIKQKMNRTSLKLLRPMILIFIFLNAFFLAGKTLAS